MSLKFTNLMHNGCTRKQCHHLICLVHTVTWPTTGNLTFLPVRGYWYSPNGDVLPGDAGASVLGLSVELVLVMHHLVSTAVPLRPMQSMVHTAILVILPYNGIGETLYVGVYSPGG